jgi:hypothetical protein
LQVEPDEAIGARPVDGMVHGGRCLAESTRETGGRHPEPPGPEQELALALVQRATLRKDGVVGAAVVTTEHRPHRLVGAADPGGEPTGGLVEGNALVATQATGLLHEPPSVRLAQPGEGRGETDLAGTSLEKPVQCVGEAVQSPHALRVVQEVTDEPLPPIPLQRLRRDVEPAADLLQGQRVTLRLAELDGLAETLDQRDQVGDQGRSDEHDLRSGGRAIAGHAKHHEVVRIQRRRLDLRDQRLRRLHLSPSGVGGRVLELCVEVANGLGLESRHAGHGAVQPSSVRTWRTVSIRPCSCALA